MENYFNVLAIHDEISFNKKCITSGEMEKTAEYYSMSGFKDYEIVIQEYPGKLIKKEYTWEEYNSQISIGQILGVIQDAIDIETDTGGFGEMGGGVINKLIKTDQLGIHFESGEKFILTVKKLS